MGLRTTYPPGTFSWVELETADPDRAAAFYTGVFGWEADDATVFRVEGSAVAGLRPVDADAPAAWRSFVTVDGVRDLAERASGLGGHVLDATGDRAVIADPQGAVVTLAEAGGGVGAERVNDVGCLCMNELLAPDLDAAVAFYGALFGWTTDASEVAAGGPMMILNDGHANAAAFAAPDGVPAHWRACFTVGDTAAAAERIRRLGGRLTLEPVMFPDGHGSIAIAVDPVGAPFSVFAGETEP